MKKFVLLAILSLSIACSKMNAQSYEYIFPSYGEVIASYYSPTATGLVQYGYNYQSVRFKANSTVNFSLSSFWNNCTDFVWYVHMPDGSLTLYGKEQSITVGSTGSGVITIDAIDRDGVRHRNASFPIYIVN